MACHYTCVTVNPLSHHSNSFDVLFEKYRCFIVARPLKHRLRNQPTFPAFISTSSSLIFAWKQCINELRFCGSFSLYISLYKNFASQNLTADPNVHRNICDGLGRRRRRSLVERNWAFEVLQEV